VRLAALIAGLLCTTCGLAAADDYGSAVDVRDVRWAAEQLLRHTAQTVPVHPRDIAIRDVVTVPGQAFVSWSIGTLHGDWGLLRIERDWWQRFSVSPQRGVYVTIAEPPLKTIVSGASFDGPTSGLLLAAGFSAALVDAALARNADVRNADTSSAATRKPFDPLTPAPAVVANTPCCSSGYDAPLAAFETPHAVPILATQGFETTLVLAANDAPADARIVHFLGRAPTRAESPAVPGGDAVYFFSFTLQSPTAVHILAGTTIDVWAPHVLDPDLAYTLTIGHTDPFIAPMRATVSDNVMHFVLPPFAIAPDAHPMAEIDGDRVHAR